MTECIVFFGPSGVGKSTLISMLMKKYPDKFSFSVSHTTRKIRSGEIDGTHYNFINEYDFLEGVKQETFIEWTKFNLNYYGTSKNAIHEATKNGTTCILDLDLNGVKSMKKESDFNCRYILIKPKSLDDLISRLEKRGTDKKVIDERFNQAKIDLLDLDEGIFDLVLINDDIDRTFDELVGFIEN